MTFPAVGCRVCEIARARSAWASPYAAATAASAKVSFVHEMLNAYGWDDEQELAPFIAAQDVYDEIWQMYDRQRRRCRQPRRQAEPLSDL